MRPSRWLGAFAFFFAILLASMPSLSADTPPDANALLSAALNLPPGTTLVAPVAVTHYRKDARTRTARLVYERRADPGADRLRVTVSEPEDAAGRAYISLVPTGDGPAVGVGTPDEPMISIGSTVRVVRPPQSGIGITSTPVAGAVRRYLLVPGRGSPKTIVGRQASREILDTHIAIQDLDRRYTEFPVVRVIGRPTIDGRSTILIEATPDPGSGRKGAMRYWVQNDAPVLVRVQSLDKKSRVEKEIRYGNVVAGEHPPFATKWEILLPDRGTRTVLNFENPRFGADVPESKFNVGAVPPK
ncbi:outer membrane lipoprotein-sorting protein [bacterium]|nr:outer membrane lipoprotein-sorting protein [bacterium]